MPEARLSATLPATHPLTVAAGKTDGAVRVAGATAGSPPARDADRGGEAAGEAALLVHLTGAGATDAAESLLAAESATGGTLRSEGDREVVHCRVGLPPLAALADAGVAFDPPATVRGRTLRLAVRTTDGRLSALRDALEERGVAFDVESVASVVSRPERLTERQERVLSTALDLGYYEVPREASVADVADAERLTKSSVTETLRRGERTLVRAYFDE